MFHADALLRPAPADDYARIATLIAIVNARGLRTTSPALLAADAGLQPEALAELTRRFVRCEPQEFLRRLAEPAHPARDDLFDRPVTARPAPPVSVRFTRVPPRRLGFGFAPSPFGESILVFDDGAIAGLGWCDTRMAAGTAADIGKHAGGREGALADMRRRWPDSRFHEDAGTADALARKVFDPAAWAADNPPDVLLVGSGFEADVWQALVTIPLGATSTYGALAASLGRPPAAARAVGTAVGANPVSFAVPCHRVLGATGAITGYHWGVVRKQAILAWEAGVAAANV